MVKIKDNTMKKERPCLLSKEVIKELDKPDTLHKTIVVDGIKRMVAK